jgi:hypothetical protein
MDAQAKPEVTSFLAVGPLPDGLKSLLRIVAEGEWRDASTEHVYRKHGREAVRAASAAFLTVVLFGRQTDPYRVMGLPPDAPLGEVRENKRLLLKWLHPDRNPEAREQEYLARVIEAAEAIESGRSHTFGSSARRRPSRSPSAPAKPAPGKRRSAVAGTGRDSWEITRAARQAVAQSTPGLRRAGKSAAVALTILLCGLIAWRYAMDEPIGASLARYSKVALGMVAWP